MGRSGASQHNRHGRFVTRLRALIVNTQFPTFAIQNAASRSISQNMACHRLRTVAAAAATQKLRS